jgi:hypothetical protein
MIDWYLSIWGYLVSNSPISCHELKGLFVPCPRAGLREKIKLFFTVRMGVKKILIRTNLQNPNSLQMWAINFALRNQIFDMSLAGHILTEKRYLSIDFSIHVCF